MLNWLFWSVPINRRIHYIICMVLLLWIVPEYIFLVQLSVLGQVINFICYDLIYYRCYQFEQEFLNKDDD
jgi:hypothetical protein